MAMTTRGHPLATPHRWLASADHAGDGFPHVHDAPPVESAASPEWSGACCKLAPMGSWSFDLTSHALRWSEELQRIFEIPPSDDARTTTEPPRLARLIHPEDRARLDQAYLSSITRRTPYEIDYRLYFPDGRIKHVREYCETFYHSDGKVWVSHGTVLDISAIKEAQHMLERSQTELRALAAQRMETLEDLRRLLAHEMHENLGQLLVALRLKVSRLRRDWIDSGGPETDAISQDMLDMLGQAIRKVRELTTLIRPATLEMGIVPALEWLADDFTRVTGIASLVRAPEDVPPLDDAQISTLFRLTQEALTNIALHADASRVEITLERDGDHYLLSVADNGKGLPPDDRRNTGVGLIAMREQLLLFGGSVLCEEASSGSGAVIRVRFPLDASRQGQGKDHD
ncbi:MAG: ATP-binding protein [Pseudomonadota bacterium]